MAGALLLWGWENGLLMWGIVLAALLEGSRLVRIRWDFSNIDLNRISDLSWALLVGTGLLLYSIEENRLLFVFRLVQWFPVCFCPIMLAQAYGNRQAMPLSVFWWLLRRQPESEAANKLFNISYCYFAICVLALSASTLPDSFFYPGVCLLVAFALTGARPRRISMTAWVVLLLLSAGAGEFSQKGLHSMQDSVERVLGGWIADFFRSTSDDRECRTRIGQPGLVPQSGKIVLRLYPGPGGFVPALLRETTWDAYRRQIWMSSNNEPVMARAGNNDNFRLAPVNNLSNEVEIASYFENGNGVLPLPHGTFEIDDVPALVKTNRMGTARIDDGPGLLDMRVFYGPGRTFDSPPCDRDLMIPSEERPAIVQIARELKLAGMTERQKIRTVERFFATDFIYTLNIPYHDPRHESTPLEYFLKRSHRGHCEYFATATVLLLRQAGVRARYVTGYAVPASARHGDTYLVRARDAHAWTLVYNDDSKLWEQVDTTPSNSDIAAAAQSPWWEPASDALSNLYFQFSKWRWNKTSYARYSVWLLVPMILYLIGRILFSQDRRRRASGPGDAGPGAPWPGLDSELYLINERLAAAQLSRMPNEPLRSWQQRLESVFPNSERLRRIFHLHRTLRFDPHGLKKGERETLRAEAQEWLAEFTKEHPPAPAGRFQAPG
jgi:hypothetical protein